MIQPEGERELSLKDTLMALPPDLKAFAPDDNFSYYERTNQMHCGPGEGGSKFTDPEVRNIFDVLKRYEGLAEKIAERADDREALKTAGAPEGAFLPATRTEGAGPEALYYKVDGVEGRLGVIQLKDLPLNTRVLVRREKGVSKKGEKTYTPVSFSVIRGTPEKLPKTDFATIIVGREPGGKDELWTIHPGPPVRPAMGEFAFTADLPGPDEVPSGEKQAVRVATVADLMEKAGMKPDEYIKIVPGDLDKISGEYQMVE